MKNYPRYKCFVFIFLLLALHSGCAPQKLDSWRQAAMDQQVIEQLAHDLIALPSSEKTAVVDSKVVEREAWQIAKALIDQTRETNKEFRMSRSPLWHNTLIKIGKRKKGYCYHWVPELLRALPSVPLQSFERHWGGSFLSMGRENNAVILTRRAAPLLTGIVYDAWRGVGRPFWKKVSEDKRYRWETRFREAEILMGEAKVEPKGSSL